MGKDRTFLFIGFIVLIYPTYIGRYMTHISIKLVKYLIVQGL